NKTIYTIVTKPVRATEIVLGRMLGFIAMGTLILIPMGLLSYVFVDRGLRHQHYEVTELKELPGSGFEGETDYTEFHSHTFTLNEDGLGLTNRVRGHQHVVQRRDDGSFDIGPPQGGLRARVPSYGEIVFRDRQGNIQEEGIDVGNERLAGGYGSAGIARLVGIAKGSRKVVHGYIEGGSLGTAEFTFDNVTPERYPDGIPIDLALRAYRSYKGNIERGIRGSLTMKRPGTGVTEQWPPVNFTVDEYDVSEQTLPVKRTKQVETTKVVDGVEVTETEIVEVSVFDELVDEDDRLTVVVRCLDRAQYLGVTQSSVYLRPSDTSFGINFFKAYLSIWLQMAMVTAFGVMFSTFLTGPVAMIATFVCVLLGFSAEQVYDTRHYIDEGIERGGGPIESMVRLLRQDAMTTQLDVDTIAAKVIKTVDAGIVYLLDAIATALPNLPKMVETAEFAASGFDIFGALLARHAVATLGYILLAFFISYHTLKSREIAA
ncbi:MAG: ABC transporter permease, partial [Planctomycetota bacterium]